MVAGLILAGGLGAGPGVRADLLINEILPDPAGGDDGREFVEFLNIGPEAVDLQGVTFEFANGSVGPVWEVRWRGAPGTVVPSGGRFLLVDKGWTGPAPGDAEADLGLQNGPDAVRLVRDGLVLDLVGYGSLDDPALSEGTPARLTPGFSLARRPDGRDSGDNRTDLVDADPTPGAANFLPYALETVDAEWDPPVVPAAGGVVRLLLVVRNAGTEALTAGPCALLGAGPPVAAWWDGADSGDERRLGFVARPDRTGRLAPEFVLPVAAAGTLRVAAPPLQVGPGPLRLSEVAPQPADGEGEWVELAWDGPGTADLAGWELADADGGTARLPAQELAAGELLVVAADSAGLVRWRRANATAGEAGCGGGAVRGAAGWPTLNNTPPADRPYADRLLLRGPDGVVVDAVTWGGDGRVAPPPGRSLERLSPAPPAPGAVPWAVCPAPGGATPGCPNAVLGPFPNPEGVFAVRPPLLDRLAGAGAVRLQFELGTGEQAWRLALYDLWGHRVRTYGGDALGPGPRDLPGDGCDDGGRAVSAGAYVAVLDTRDAAGRPMRRDRRVVMVR